MVDLSEIRKSNAKNATQSRGGVVCVFAGATAGIGFATLSEMVVLLHSSTFYVLGRDPSRYLDKIEGLRKAGPTNKIVFLGIQVELIKEIDEACHCIRAEEEKIDIVCVSPGGMPFQGTVCKYLPAAITSSIPDTIEQIQKKD
jgi:NADP-dependent 3-hydroxy acid dehydrogenase YdfG